MKETKEQYFKKVDLYVELYKANNRNIREGLENILKYINFKAIKIVLNGLKNIF